MRKTPLLLMGLTLAGCGEHAAESRPSSAKAAAARKTSHADLPMVTLKIPGMH